MKCIKKYKIAIKDNSINPQKNSLRKRDNDQKNNYVILFSLDRGNVTYYNVHKV